MTHGQTLIKFAEQAYKGKYMNKGEMKKAKINMEHVEILIQDGLMLYTRSGNHKNATHIWGLTSKGQNLVEITKMVNGL